MPRAIAPVIRLHHGLRPEFRDQARGRMDAPEFIPTGCHGNGVFVPSSSVSRGVAFNPSVWPDRYFEGSDRVTFTDSY